MFLTDVRRIADAGEKIATELEAMNVTLGLMESTLAQLLGVLSPEIVGIAISPGAPTAHKESVMPSCKLVKKSACPKKAAAGKVGAVADFVLLDNEDDTCTVLGVDAAGNQVDIAAVADLAPPPASDNPSVLTVDPPSGMTFAMHAVGPLGTANVTATATWKDGSKGPFTFTLPVRVDAGSPTGLVIVPGIPTVR